MLKDLLGRRTTHINRWRASTETYTLYFFKANKITGLITRMLEVKNDFDGLTGRLNTGEEGSSELQDRQKLKLKQRKQ